ncbi:MAG TPA: SpoIIE family protein phosphatase [Candidatus Acidoferrum sp.]
MKILIAEDDELSRRLLEKKLLDWKHIVFTTNNGQDAWEILQEEEIDLIFSDWNMPRLDGLELCQRIRRSCDFAKYTYIILCTGKHEPQERWRALEAGADDFLLKPVDFLELEVRLRAVERHVRLQKELARQNSELRELNEELGSIHRVIQEDLEAAVAAQVEMLPSPIVVPGVLNVDWLYLPARDLAGDMFGYELEDGSRLTFFHLDVAGRGIPAALLSISVMKFLTPGHAGWKNGGADGVAITRSPASIVAELNDKFLSETQRYFTICCGDLDLETGLVRLCQAGQPSPIRIRDDRVACEPVKGFPVGLWHPMQYEETQLQLSRGEQLILYSDGVTGNTNHDGQRLGERRWLEALAEINQRDRKQFPQESQRLLLEWHGGSEFEDDVSILRLQWLGPVSRARMMANSGNERPA